MAKLCNVDDLFYMLENSSAKEIRQAVRSLEKFWRIKLPKMPKGKKLSEAQRLAQDALFRGLRVQFQHMGCCPFTYHL